jgi:FtsP/CotA-like multicopper oxidase with cupredoxin domain
LAGAGSLAGRAFSAAPRYPTAPLPPQGADIVDVTLTARLRPRPLLPAPAKLTPTLGYGDGPAVLRIRQGQWLRATLNNEMAEHTTVHWHGIRLPNGMDGVPYLTQDPVLPGRSFTYAFQPPDCGTFFFHPHCDTITQLGEGLAGVLIVEGDTTQPYDTDLVCLYRDWRLNEDGSFSALTTAKGAGTAGTFGAFQTVNDQHQPVFKVPANGDIRVRFLNVDMTRLIDLGLDGAEGWMIATDGNALEPTRLETWRMGPAMRLDIAFRAPKSGTVKLMNYYAAEPIVLASFEAEGTPLERPAFVPTPLKASPIPEPKPGGAIDFTLRLSAASAPSPLPADLKLPNGETLPLADSLCLTQRTFWAMNGQTWPAMEEGRLPPPLASFQQGKTIVAEVVNATPHPHPIHIHGHTFKVLSSNKRQVLPHFADTALVTPKERLKIAFVADNPGAWMLHCHIIEHQETGMMGYVLVA